MTKSGRNTFHSEFSESEIDAICHDEQVQEDAAEVFDSLQNEIEDWGKRIRHELTKH